jgi:CBS domain-containing protein
MRIRDILRRKGSEVVTVSPDTPLQEAMRTLVSHNIGALVVVADGAVCGIVSERDVLRAGAENLAILAAARVRDVMTGDVVTESPAADLRTVMDTLTERRIRHLPVLEDGRLCGMVSIGDVVNAVRETIEQENVALHSYIAGA